MSDEDDMHRLKVELLLHTMNDNLHSIRTAAWSAIGIFLGFVFFWYVR